MADTKISALTALAATPDVADLVEILDVSDSSMAASGTNKKITYSNLLGATLTKRLQIPAAALWPSTTAGCAAIAKTESTTNKVNFQSLDFDATTQEYAEFGLFMPTNWDAGTVVFKVMWTAASGSGGVTWSLEATSLADGDAVDTSWGTAVLVSDTLIAANDCHITADSAAVTVGNTPAGGEFVQFRVSRVPADAGDTLAVDAKLIAVRVLYNLIATA